MQGHACTRKYFNIYFTSVMNPKKNCVILIRKNTLVNKIVMIVSILQNYFHSSAPLIINQQKCVDKFESPEISYLQMTCGHFLYVRLNAALYHGPAVTSLNMDGLKNTVFCCQHFVISLFLCLVLVSSSLLVCLFVCLRVCCLQASAYSNSLMLSLLSCTQLFIQSMLKLYALLFLLHFFVLFVNCSFSD